MRTIRFARLSFEKKLSHYADHRDAIERRKEVLLDVIDFSTDVNSLLEGTDMKSKIERGQWYFGDIDVGDDYISGRLGKEKDETGREPNEDVEGFVEVERPDTDVAFFVIDLNTSVMAYEYRVNVGRKAPFRILEAAFNSYHKGEEDLSFSPLVDKEEVREEIARLRKVTQIHFSNLTPTNPNSTPSSKPMDDFLESSQIDRLLFDGKNESDDRDDEGIRVEEEPLLDGGLSLAEEGYGSATVKGEDEDGEEVEVTTDEAPTESEVEIGDSDEVNRKKLIEQIREVLEDLED